MTTTNIEFRITDKIPEEGQPRWRVDMRLPRDGGLTDGWSHMITTHSEGLAFDAIGDEAGIQHKRNQEAT